METDTSKGHETEESKDQMIQPQFFNGAVTPLGFHRYSSEFLEVRKNTQLKQGFWPVRYYLIGHALELALKAFLLVKKVPIKEIKSKSLGHNLNSIIERAERLELSNLISIAANERYEFIKECAYYKEKEFEYFGPNAAPLGGYKSLPYVDVLIAFCERILIAILPLCKSFNP